MKSSKSIPVGHACAYKFLKGNGGVGVWQKAYQDGTRRVAYIIASVPSVLAYNEPPSSVLAEFAAEGDAIKTLSRWAADPLPAQPIRQKAEQPIDPAQGELGLGPFKTKGQVQFDSLRRQAEESYWRCVGCDRIHDRRDAAWFCCKIGTTGA
jgi:hypothetical protein